MKYSGKQPAPKGAKAGASVPSAKKPPKVSLKPGNTSGCK